jgi:hypothetical protein
VRARVADPVDALDRRHRTEQVGEQRSGPASGIIGPLGTGDEGVVGGRVDPAAGGGEVAAVGVHVLAEEGHLEHTVGGEALDLGHELPEGTADLPAPDRRDDAVGAGVVATDLEGEPGRVVDLALDGQGGGEGLRLVHGLVPDLGHRAARLPRGVQQLDGPVHVVGAHDDVDVTGPGLDEVAVLLGQAAAHDDLEPGPGVLLRLQVTELAVELVVGVLTDAAGVEDHHVGVVLGRGGHEAVGLQQPGEPLGVVLVHLAPVGADGVGPGGHGQKGYRPPSTGPPEAPGPPHGGTVP